MTDTGHDLARIVAQVADPYDFFTALVQNAVDAGATEVEVRIGFEVEAGERTGLLAVEVEDFGEGMNAAGIDERLTRLFRSRGDGDLTTLGRLGIGFASVFAIEPAAVVIDTARDGESWRVLFEPDGRYTRLRLPDPLDGTTVRLLKELDCAKLAEFEDRSREALQRGCRHLAVPVRFQGAPMNEPLSVESPCVLHESEGGIEIVVGYGAPGEEWAGFYRHGITLWEGAGRFVDEGLVSKVSSPWLEPTLGGDGVLRDAHYAEVMARVETLARGDLPRHLFSAIEDAVRRGGRAASLDLLYAHASRLFARWGAGARPDALRAEIAGRVFARSVSGREVSVGEVLKRALKGRLLWEREASDLTGALEEEGWLVLDRDIGDAFRELAARSALERARDRFCRPVPLEDDRIEAAGALLDAVRAGARLRGVRLRGVHLAHFGSGAASERVGILLRKPGALTPVGHTVALGRSPFGAKHELALNADHPLIVDLVRLAVREPELAAHAVFELIEGAEEHDPIASARGFEALLGVRAKRREDGRP